jgi:hypothetical protein
MKIKDLIKIDVDISFEDTMKFFKNVPFANSGF